MSPLGVDDPSPQEYKSKHRPIHYKRPDGEEDGRRRPAPARHPPSSGGASD